MLSSDSQALQILGTSFYCVISPIMSWTLSIALSFRRHLPIFFSLCHWPSKLSWGLLHPFYTWANGAGWNSENSSVTRPRAIARVVKPGTTPQLSALSTTLSCRGKRARGIGSPPRSPPDSQGLRRWAYPWPIDLRKWESNWSQAAVASGEVIPRNGLSVAHNRRPWMLYTAEHTAAILRVSTNIS